MLAALLAGGAAQEKEVPSASLRINLKPEGAVPSLLPPLPSADDPEATMDPVNDPATAPVPPGAVAALPAPVLPPGLPPLGLPSDGEPAPAFPGLPDLPNFIPSSPAALPGFQPGETPSAVPQEMPVPEGAAPAAGTPPGPAPVVSMAERHARSGFAYWHKSPKQARDIAMKEGKCLLLAMTGGPNSAPSRDLSKEVFGTSQFNAFALKSMVLSSLDYDPADRVRYGVTAPSEEDQQKAARLDAMAHCRKSLGIKGFPTVILFGPDGKEITRFSGYQIKQPRRASWYPEKYFQRIKEAVAGELAARETALKAREKLIVDGYREWTSAQGSKLFAKLVEARPDQILLKDESGKPRAVKPEQLYIADREVIRRQRIADQLKQ